MDGDFSMKDAVSGRRTQAQRRAASRQAVLDSACRLFGEKGYTGTSLEEIAEDCGLTIRPIYHYFGNKKALFAAVNQVMEAGFSACSGGIIGLGERPSQRLDMAFSLKDMGVDCVPINILDPRPGTPLENVSPPRPLEIIRTLALFRLILPDATIKIAGGRERNLGDFQAMALRAGANGMIIGGYLTTSGRSLDTDLTMIRQAGFVLENRTASVSGS